jgi:hypothetical protein
VRDAIIKQVYSDDWLRGIGERGFRRRELGNRFSRNDATDARLCVMCLKTIDRRMGYDLMRKRGNERSQAIELRGVIPDVEVVIEI